MINSSDGWLSDEIIDGFMIKMKNEFPNINGLQSVIHFGRFVTDSRTKKFSQSKSCHPRFVPLPKSGFFVQILNIMTRSHWICVSGNLEESDITEIHVYDSINRNNINDETNSLVSSLFKNHDVKQFEYICHNVTQQNDSSFCGLHSIANAIILCRGGKPETHRFNKFSMRKQLSDMIESGGNVSLFESWLVESKTRAKRIRRDPVFCECRQTQGEKLMIQCNRCYDYFHIDCIQSALDLDDVNCL